MKVVLVTEKFKQALSLVDRVVSGRSSLPILNNLAIRTTDGQVVIEATDLELAVSLRMGGKISVDGGVTVPAKILNSFVGGLTDEVVELDVENNVLKIKSGNTQTKINGTDINEFPVVPSVDGQEVLSFDPKILNDAINSVAFAISPDNSRAILTGMLFNLETNQLVLAATDSYRLAEKVVEDPKSLKITSPKKIVIPGRVAKEVGKMLMGEKEVKIIWSETQIAFVGEGIKIVSRLLDGEYPDYTKIIPTKIISHTNFQTSDLIKKISNALVFARDGANTLKLYFEKKNLRIEAVSQDVGEYKTEAENTGDEAEMVITVNGRFLLDGLNAFSSATWISIGLVDSNSPILISAKEVDKMRCLVMPMKS